MKKALVGLVLLALVIGGGFFLNQRRAAKSAGAGKRAAGPVAVTVATATTRDVPVQLTGIGTARPFAAVAVKSQQKGALTHVGFKDGDEVAEGALIFTIDPRPFEAAVSQAQAFLDRDKAQLAKAEADLRRTEELFEKSLATASARDQDRATVNALKATVAADEAAVHNAKVQAEFCNIRAPLAGRVGLLLVNRGNIVKDGDTVLAVINQLKPIYVDFGLPEQSLAAVREAAAAGPVPVTAMLPQQPGRSAAGKLAVINNEVDKATGTILVRAEFPNADEWLWPGQFVDVALTLRVEKDAVVVPQSAINLGQRGPFAFVVKPDQTVELRPVKTGSRQGADVVVTQGVAAGEHVVTSGQLRLINGAKVEVKDNKPPAGK
jgi:multidrug efflux system membrane fusion protein